MSASNANMTAVKDREFHTLKHKLEQLSYMHPLDPTSAPLVSRLLADLLLATQSNQDLELSAQRQATAVSVYTFFFRHASFIGFLLPLFSSLSPRYVFPLSSLRAPTLTPIPLSFLIPQLDVLQAEVSPLRHENGRLVRENNQVSCRVVHYVYPFPAPFHFCVCCTGSSCVYFSLLLLPPSQRRRHTEAAFSHHLIPFWPTLHTHTLTHEIVCARARTASCTSSS